MSEPLSKIDFASQLYAQIALNMDALYEAHLAAKANPFPNATEPMATPEFTAEKSGQEITEVKARIEELESRMGQEKLALAIGGTVLTLAIAAAKAGV